MMGAMSQNQQAADDDPAVPAPAGPAPARSATAPPGSTGPARAGGRAEVMEWGNDARPQRRARMSRLLAVMSDRRLVSLSAVLGAVALFGSLISEWQVTAVDGLPFGSTEVGLQPLPSGLGDLGGWGGGYLIGLFVLVTAAVLMLFGPPAGRAYARLVTISTGGVLLALLVAIASALHTYSRALTLPQEVLALQDDQVVLTTGRGGYCAAAGVLLVILTAMLVGRRLPAASTAAADTPAADAGPELDWPWRRPQQAGDDETPGTPLELTVSATEPFSPLTDPPDPYGRPGAISG
jgi:hypothetical protein